MTKSSQDEPPATRERCRWCRRVLPVRSGPGRPRAFCSQRCRQWDWVAGQRARDLALAEGELVVARRALDELHDDLFVLACAVDDAVADVASLGDAAEPRQLLEVIGALLDAARPLRDRELRPSPAGR